MLLNKFSFFLLVLLFADTFCMAYQTFVDERDGLKYNTIQIGSQVWMAENLNYGGDNNGFCYEQNEGYCGKFGRLYLWDEALRVCPEGWHLPSREEFETLLDYVGYDSGKRLKSTKGWLMYDDRSGNGDEEYGFSANPAGFYDNEFRNFQGIGSSAFYWSSDEGLGDAYYLSFGYDKDYAQLEKARKDRGQSVRCVQNQERIAFYHEEDKYETNENLGSGYGAIEDGVSYSANELTDERSYESESFEADTDDYVVGKRSERNIRKVVDEGTRTVLKKIYNIYLKKRPGFGGVIKLRFTIASNGEITSISTVSSTTGYDTFDNEVKNFVSHWNFGVAGAPCSVTVPFTFDSGNDTYNDGGFYENEKQKSSKKSSTKRGATELFLDVPVSLSLIGALDRYDNSLDEMQITLGVGGFADFSGFHIALDLFYSIAIDSSFHSDSTYRGSDLDSDKEFTKYHLNNNKFGFALKAGVSMHKGLGNYGRRKGEFNVEIGAKMEKFYGVPMLFGGYFCFRPFGEIGLSVGGSGEETFVKISYSNTFNLFNTSW
ncbi:MAG: TonB family protein [Fibrobacter sp.]|nr:TonB family protein [Fibrobacter sp.]